MSPERWHTLEQWFQKARAAATSAEQEQLLAQLTQTDPVLATEVGALLNAEDEAAHFLSGPSVHLDSLATALPTSIGNYRIEQLLGWGGMGIVYLARAKGLLDGRPVAIKVARTTLIAEDDLSNHLLHEARSLSHLQHPHIAHLYEAGMTQDGELFFAMEYIEGVPLDIYIQDHAPSLETSLLLCRQLARAAHYAHQKTILHRDIKPSNVLVVMHDEAPYVKLLDFGLSLLDQVPPHDKRGARNRFTIWYTAPEVLAGERCTVASDVYSLGLVLYECLTHSKATHEVSQAPPAPSANIAERMRYASRPERKQLRRKARRLKGDLDSIVERALAPRPEDRYASAAALHEDLRRYQQGLPLIHAPQHGLALVRRLWRSTQNYRTHISLAVIGLLTVALGLLTYGPIDRQVVSVNGQNLSLNFLNAQGDVIHSVTRQGKPLTSTGSHPFATLGDMDSDGLNELFWIDPPNNTYAPSVITAYSVQQRQILWSVPIQPPEVSYPYHPEDTDVNVFAPRRVLSLSTPMESCKLYLVANHPSLFVGMLREIDCATGATKHEFVNAGWLETLNLYDVGDDGELDLLVGTTSNAFGAALLYVLNPDRIQGQGVYMSADMQDWPLEQRNRYASTLPMADMRTVLWFQPSEINRLTGLSNPRVRWINPTSSSRTIQLQVEDGADRTLHQRVIQYETPALNITFSHTLAPTAAITSGGFDMLARSLFKSNAIGALPDTAFRQTYLDNIRYYAPETGAWLPYPDWAADHAPWPSSSD